MEDDENACVRNIVKEIMRECASRKLQVNKNFVTYVTKQFLIDPNWGIGDDFFNQRENVQEFVKFVIHELVTARTNVKMITMKIQFYLSCNLEHMQQALETNMNELKIRIDPLEQGILNTTKLESKEEIDFLCRRIACYNTLLYGLGDPSKSKVYDEAMAALKSILDDDELKEFVSLPSKTEKMDKLQQFAAITTGIRIFNKDCNKGGEGIANLPDLINKGTEAIREATEEILLNVMEKVNLMTTTLDKSYVIAKTMEQVRMKLDLPHGMDGKDIEMVKDLLIFFRQFELLVRKILEEIDKIEDKSTVILEGIEKTLDQIHETVHMKIAVPVPLIFPFFQQLAEVWELYQNQAIHLSRISTIMKNLAPFSQPPFYDQELMERLGSTKPMTDAERLSSTAEHKLKSDNDNIRVIHAESIKNIDRVEFEYLGFCPWKLVETDGALIPGNPSMGVVKYARKFYVFSRVEGYVEFSKDPELFINYILDLARKKPQLITFFQLKDDLENVYGIKKLTKSRVEIRLCEDKAVGGEIGMQESLIDPKYKWNVWDLKREALTLTKTANCKTVSTQSHKTSSNNSVKAQTYAKKKVGVQTMKKSYTNVPRPLGFFHGLRGRKDDKQVQLDLTSGQED